MHVSSLKKAPERVIKDDFANDPFTLYTFRQTYGARHSRAGMELPALGELAGHSNSQTTTSYMHAARKQEIEATAKLQANVEAAWKAKTLQEKQETERFKPLEDEWGNPIYESVGGSPQNFPQRQKLRICHFDKVTLFL